MLKRGGALPFFRQFLRQFLYRTVSFFAILKVGCTKNSISLKGMRKKFYPVLRGTQNILDLPFSHCIAP